jgi:BirA family biotin operon repressor/biotin-[acetyl-CoA-carboxylase] ligase
MIKNEYKVFGRVDFDFEKFLSNLNTNVLGRKILFFESVTSTNDIAREYAENGEWGLCILAEEQTKGRGTHGRSWSTYKGKSIALSIVLHPDWIKDTSLLSIAAAKAVIRTLEKYNLNATLKFPNDVYLNEKKVCGILTEIFYSSEKVKYAILGIGININQEKFEDELKDIAISIKQVLGYEIPREEFLAILLECLPLDILTF